MTRSCKAVYVIIFKIFFDLTIFKFFIEFVTILLLFYVLGFFFFFNLLLFFFCFFFLVFFFFFGHEACGNLAPNQESSSHILGIGR